MTTDAPSTAPGQIKGRNTTPLWWAYFGFLCLWFTLGMVSATYVRAGLLFGASALVDLICVFGLYCYIAERPFVSVWLWRVILAIYLAKVSFGIYTLSSNLLRMLHQATLYPWHLGREAYVSMLALASVLIVIPMVIALWNYSFHSPTLWRRAV